MGQLQEIYKENYMYLHQLVRITLLDMLGLFNSYKYQVTKLAMSNYDMKIGSRCNVVELMNRRLNSRNHITFIFTNSSGSFKKFIKSLCWCSKKFNLYPILLLLRFINKMLTKILPFDYLLHISIYKYVHESNLYSTPKR